MRSSLYIPIYGFIPWLKHHHKHNIIPTRTWNEDSLPAFQADIKNIPWENLKSQSSINEKVRTWSEFIGHALDKHFPLRKKRIRQNTHPWIDSSILKLMRYCDHIHKTALKFDNEASWTSYRRLRNQVTRVLRKNKRDYFRNKLEANKKKSKNLLGNP